MKYPLAAAALLLAAGCDRMVPPGPSATYAPHEAGLTLVYDSPGQPSASKLQVRVKKTEAITGGSQVVETFGSLAGEMEITFRHRDGGVAMVRENQDLLVLPAGFPDRVSRWEVGDSVSTVIGLARVDLPGVKLPDPDAVGVWVETVPAAPGGLRLRRLVVPDLGDVQELIWKDGRWVTVTRLVSMGYTDPPTRGSAR